jgi:hypothetical protein
MRCWLALESCNGFSHTDRHTHLHKIIETSSDIYTYIYIVQALPRPQSLAIAWRYTVWRMYNGFFTAFLEASCMTSNTQAELQSTARPCFCHHHVSLLPRARRPLLCPDFQAGYAHWISFGLYLRPQAGQVKAPPSLFTALPVLDSGLQLD